MHIHAGTPLGQPFSKRPCFGLQKAVFHAAKGHLLQCKRRPFALRPFLFCILPGLQYLCMTQAMPANLHAGLRLDRKIQPTMNIRTIHSVYFSATYTTRKVVREIARVIGCETVEHDVTCALPPAGICISPRRPLMAPP